MRNTIADNMKKVLIHNGRHSVWYGDITLIEECAALSGIKTTHPQATIQATLNGLDRSDLFIKSYITADINGYTRRYRCFTLKETAED